MTQTTDQYTPLDVWLRFTPGQDNDDLAEAEANTYHNEDGTFRVEWYHNSVGVVKKQKFSSHEAARAWLTREGFEDFTA